MNSNSSPSYRSQDDTTLLMAVTGGDISKAQILLARGASVNTRKNNGKTLLLIAVEKNNPGMVKLLLDHKASVNTWDNRTVTPLMLAAEKGDTGILKLLLGAGAAPDILDSRGKSALRYAVDGGNPDAVKILMESGADLNTRDNYGESLMYAAAKLGHISVMGYLLDRNLDPDIPNKAGATPLYGAAWDNREEAVQLLIQRGANPNCTTNTGTTPLMNASQYGRKTIVELLIKSGADINAADVKGRTALTFARQQGGKAIADFLVAHGAQEIPEKPEDDSPLIPDRKEPRNEIPEPSPAFRKFRSSFFQHIDPYIMWHDGVDPYIFGTIDSLSPEEKSRAETLFLESLDKEYDQRWVDGLVYLKSLRALDLFRKMLKTDPSVNLAAAIVLLDHKAPEITLITDTITADIPEYHRIDALALLKELIRQGIFQFSPPPFITSALLKAVTAEECLVRIHAADAVKMLHGLPLPERSEDPLFGLIVRENPEGNHRDIVEILKKMISGDPDTGKEALGTKMEYPENHQ